MNIVQVIAGAVILFFGRKLFWLFVGIAGFLAGSRLGALIFAGHPQWMVLLVAAAVGLAGVLVAIFFERVAFAVARFFAGAYLAAGVATTMGFPPESAVSLLIGGVVGAILAAMIMDWAIVSLSCLTGAGAVVSDFRMTPGLQLGLWIALCLAGFLFQARSLRKPKIRKPVR